MAYTENTIQHIREALQQKNAAFYEKAMFGGICFMVDDKMLCACKIDKATGEDRLMCRINPDIYEELLQQEHVTPMKAGKVMNGFIHVAENGFKTASQLNYWLQLCLDYNPLAKPSGK